jgi:tRNA modification GTPase
MRSGDTIVAISTPPGRGGIGVVRLSGPLSVEYSSTIFQPHSAGQEIIANRARFGLIIDPASGEHVDEAVFTHFRAPHSYTGEDVVELSCHGSPVVLARVVDMLTAAGARIAEPGEFTFRAFFNRRIDLAQAQAVRDIIDAQTQYQARVATSQLEGSLSKRLQPLEQDLIDVIVQIESSIEFVEDDISTAESPALRRKLENIENGLRVMADSFAFGKYVRSGFDLAIVGRPNVGKSSVFNRLVGTDRAIVTALPGTTRDALYETTSIAGVPVRLIDTAGVRATADVVESLGIERTRTAIADADVVLLVLDRSEPLTADDFQLFDIVDVVRRVVVLNKSDLPARADLDSLPDSNGIVTISAATGAGFDRLTKSLFGLLTAGSATPERHDVLLTDARQHAAIRRSVDQIAAARELMVGGELEEIVLLKLRGTLESIGQVTGETLTEDILAQIFSTFCIGK